MEQKFIENEKEKQVFKNKLKTKIDFALLNRKNYSLEKLKSDLQRSSITMVLRQNEAGLVYGITYIDFVHKTVFNGSALGKAYSAKGLLERCENGITQEKVNAEKSATKETAKENKQTSRDAMVPTTNAAEQGESFSSSNVEIEATKIIGLLFRDEQGFDFLPDELRLSREKKRKRKVLRKNL